MSSSDKRSVLLMHPVRRDIYRIISETPGSYFFEIASTLELSHGTLSWHLKKLEESDLVGTMRFAGRRVFFSRALRTEEIERAFLILKSSATQNVFAYVMNNPGCYQAQISEALEAHHDTIRHHIQRLKKAKLIDSIKQGRTVRYTLGEVGNIILNSNTEIISKAYVEHLFAVLKEECLIPEVIDQSDGRLTIRVSCPGKDDVFLTLELRDWEFIPENENEEEDENEDEPLDNNGDAQSKDIQAVGDFSRRPRIVRTEDEDPS
ncbi:MAG: helix-turn-helix domain-containing protein [Candidatus Heimdallarchaeota archaeon]|nr:helix-turn-helix domain-containing protein [Candidatus Heimdallarchaeota archaeon]